MAVSPRTGRIAERVLCVLAAFALATPAAANINLEWRPASQTVLVGDPADIGLYAVSDDPEMDQLLSAVDLIFSWEPGYLELLGVDDTGGAPSSFSGFPAGDPFGLNEVVPPQDGDGLYSFWAPLGAPVAATPEGTLLTTFQFTALHTTSITVLDMLESGGSPQGDTVVWDGTIPNNDVTGTLDSAEITIFCMVCPGDLNGDNYIDLSDLAELLAHYGMTSGAIPEEGDIDCDGDVDLSDLAALLAVYHTTCP